MSEQLLRPQRTVDEALIQEIARKIAQAFHPRRIILFGSRARGEARQDSDIDLFVELETSDKPLDRYIKIIRLFRDRWWPMDLIVMTPEEVRERQNSTASIIPWIEREGRILFDSNARP
jgi:predicted nucleotidyltransferase